MIPWEIFLPVSIVALYRMYCVHLYMNNVVRKGIYERYKKNKVNFIKKLRSDFYKLTADVDGREIGRSDLTCENRKIPELLDFLETSYFIFLRTK